MSYTQIACVDVLLIEYLRLFCLLQAFLRARIDIRLKVFPRRLPRAYFCVIICHNLRFALKVGANAHEDILACQ